MAPKIPPALRYDPVGPEGEPFRYHRAGPSVQDQPGFTPGQRLERIGMALLDGEAVEVLEVEVTGPGFDGDAFVKTDTFGRVKRVSLARLDIPSRSQRRNMSLRRECADTVELPAHHLEAIDRKAAIQDATPVNVFVSSKQ